MATGTTGTEGSDKMAAAKAAAGRGPSYPALPIEQAIAKAVQFWSAEKRSAAPIAAAAKHWGYSETSSSGKMVVAALLHYGLLEDQGAKDDRTVKLTGRALDIVLDAQESPQRLKAIQDAVRAPKLYADILAKWGAQELPSDQTLRYYLLREKSFNDSTVDSFIKDFRASVAYAKLDKTPTITAGNMPDPGSKTDAGGEVKSVEVGDLIQWEAAGVLRLDAPRRVRAAQEHEGSWWVFVEGSETGIPMSEAVVVEKKQVEAPKAPPTLALAQPPFGTTSQVVAVTPAGEREWLRGSLSREVSYRLLVSGELGSKEIGKLIRLLEAQKAVLAEEDDL